MKGGFEDETSKAEEQKSRNAEVQKSPSNIEGVPEGRSSLYENITLIPNPTSGELTIDNEQLIMNNIEVFDIYGRKQNVEFNSYGLTVLRSYGLTNLPAGIYFVKITSEQGVVIKKVIKQ